MADISLNDLASYWPLFRPSGPGFQPRFAYPILDSESRLPKAQETQPTDGVPESLPEGGSDQFRSLWMALVTGKDETFDEDGTHQPGIVVGSDGEGQPVETNDGSIAGPRRQPPFLWPVEGMPTGLGRPAAPSLVWLSSGPERVGRVGARFDRCLGADVLIRGCTPQRVLPHVGTFSTEPIDSKPMVIVGGALVLPLLIETAAAALAAKGLFEGAAIALSWGRAVILAL